MQYYYNNIALLFATGRTWQKHPLFLSYLLQSPRKATFHVPFRFVWPVKWVEDLQRESYKLLQQLPNRERAATALWFYHCMQVTVVPWLLWAVWLSTGTVCDSNFDACFEYVRLVLCKSIESMRDFFATFVVLFCLALARWDWYYFVFLPPVHWEALRVCTSLHQSSFRFNLPQRLHLICQALTSVDVSAESSSDCALDTVCWIFSGLTKEIGWKKLQPFPRATRLFYDVAHCSPIHYDCINRCKPKQVSCILLKIAMAPIISSVRLTCSLHLLSSFL